MDYLAQRYSRERCSFYLDPLRMARRRKSDVQTMVFSATVLIAALFMLVGCAPAATPTPEKVVETVVVRETVEVQVTPTPMPEAPKPTGEITIWGWPAADKAFEAIIEGFNLRLEIARPTGFVCLEREESFRG
jgi:hypothetical protein